MQNPFPCLISNDNTYILAVLGIIFIVKIVRSLSKLTVRFLEFRACSYYRPYKYINKYGNWAAITGCTAGIGRALAKEIAKRGINLVLISRNINKLQTLAREIETDYKVQTKIIINDATDKTSTKQMAEELSKLNLGLLINNVGINFEEEGMRFCHTSANRIANMVTVNCGNGLIAMKYVLPKMIAARNGLVINVCSSTSYIPAPLQALYSGTKVYMACLGESINCELASTGVSVQSICPIFVQSDMTVFSGVLYNYLCITGDTYARSAVNVFGLKQKLTGHWFFDIVEAIYHAVGNDTFTMKCIYLGASCLEKYNL